jgi:hypothetical protein
LRPWPDGLARAILSRDLRPGMEPDGTAGNGSPSFGGSPEHPARRTMNPFCVSIPMLPEGKGAIPLEWSVIDGSYSTSNCRGTR